MRPKSLQNDTRSESEESRPPLIDSFGVNAGIVEEIRQRYEQNPRSVDPSWAEFFGGEPGDGRGLAAVAEPPSDGGAGTVAAAPPLPGAEVREGAPGLDPQAAAQQAKALRLIHAFRTRGHRIADTDPLKGRQIYFPDVDPLHYGFTGEDLDREFIAGDLPGGPIQSLRRILELLRATYCGSVGVEVMHIQDAARRGWLISRMEQSRNRTAFDAAARLRILQKLSAAEIFEKFVHIKFLGQKRFSLEGAESLIPLLDCLVEDAPSSGIRELVIGMAHRGRLNVLSNIVGKSLESIFSEFEDIPDPGSPFGSGDVKYHKGFSSDRITESGVKIHLSLTSNPSHLEAVNPVVEGRARAKQIRAGDLAGHTILPLLLHGDAAFAGQGMVAETLNLSQLRGYSTGGTIHVVVDNQIGFTTTPAEARSTLYATDVAKMIQVPIFHVNGDDPEAVLHVTKLALAYRQRFHSDVVIDMVCYRRHGHNEGDEPMFTQPILYSRIKKQRPVRKLYTDKLLGLGLLDERDVNRIEEDLRDQLAHALQHIQTKPTRTEAPYQPRGPWSGYSRTAPEEEPPTAVPQEKLSDLVLRASRVPEDFKIHRKLQAMLEHRSRAVEERGRMDWAFGEIMAYATLLAEGFSVRISGQDSSRGTFSHRHAVLVDQESGEEYAPLAHLSASQGRFEVYDSLLSEAGVLGFEYGYSLADPNTLTIWEAQFGDFANGAQVIIDQFVASSYVKWQRLSGLVMFLPHGYEGQGPEHSSARIERFLQLCAEDNLQVMNWTTPAQFFHGLRRHIHRMYRTPLVLFTPKSLLRHPAATSRLEEFTGGGFRPVLDDEATAGAPREVRRILFCSGKVYYDLLAGREGLDSGGDSVALVRIEQLYPWPTDAVAEILSRYSRAKEVCWVQEEPANMGAWSYVRDILEEAMETASGKGARPRYIGLPAAASPAVGSHHRHQQNQQAIVTEAFAGLEVPAASKRKR
jgi:2-oxoglutarate dehydrogenase E1 component